MIMVRSIAFRFVESSMMLRRAALRCTTLKFRCARLSSSALEDAVYVLQHFTAPDIRRVEAEARVTFFVRMAVSSKDHSLVRFAGGFHIAVENERRRQVPVVLGLNKEDWNGCAFDGAPEPRLKCRRARPSLGCGRESRRG